MKKLIGIETGSYTFDPVNKQITFQGLGSLKLEQILIITNVTDNIMLYNFTDPALGGSVSNNILTLDFDTTAMDAADSLQIFVDIQEYNVIDGQIQDLNEDFFIDTNMQQVMGSQPLTEQGNLKTKTIFQDRKISGKLGSSGEVVSIDCSGCQTVTVQLSGTWAGTQTFEANADGGNFVAISGIGASSQTPVTTTTSNSIYRFNTVGLSRLQVRFSTYTSGTALISITASGGQAAVQNTVTNIVGSQSQPISQKATTFEANTYDTNIATVLGTSTVIRPGFASNDFPIAPTVNITPPTTYIAPNFANAPQILPRVRVEAGGSQKLPLAQEINTNKLFCSNPDMYRIMESILIQSAMQTQILAQAFNITLPSGWEEIR